MDTRLLWLLWVANFDINLNTFICCTVLKAQNKISKLLLLLLLKLYLKKVNLQGNMPV